jgi:hypothetical protein
MICIISCGQIKLNRPAKASDLYIGRLFKSALKFARRNFDENAIFIISAKYGLIPTNKIIAPYDNVIGKNELITIEMVIAQAELLGILNQEIMVIGGKKYYDFIKKVFKDTYMINPIEGLTIGLACSRLK